MEWDHFQIVIKIRYLNCNGKNTVTKIYNMKLNINFYQNVQQLAQLITCNTGKSN